MNLLPAAVKIRLMKRIDSFIGKPVVQLLPAPTPGSAVQMRSILIIRPGGIGDALLLAPAINLIRCNYPDVFITILAERRNGEAFSLIPTINRLLLYDTFTGLSHLLKSQYDLIIDTEQWHRLSAVIARVLTSPLKIGFDTNERRRLFTDPVPYSHDDYEAQSFLHLLQPLGIYEKFEHTAPFLSVPGAARKEIEAHTAALQSPYIVIFPGASIQERRWSVEKFRLLAQRFANSGVTAVIIGGKDDQLSGETILSGTHGFNFAGKTSIAGSAAIIAGSRLLVSGDSGVLHIGAGLGIPTVSLFGAGIARKWAPQGKNHTVINRGFSCSPCTLFGTTPDCKNNVRCLNEIEVDEVYSAADALIFK